MSLMVITTILNPNFIPQFVPNAEKQQPAVDSQISSLVQEKLSVSKPASAQNKTWAQKASQQQNDSNNNNSLSGNSNQATSQKKVVTTTSVAVTAVPGRSPMASPKASATDSTPSVVGNGALKMEGGVHKTNAILQTDVVSQQQPQKKLETNTVSVTATPAAINGGVVAAAEKVPKSVPVAATTSSPSSWASLFASSQKPSANNTVTSENSNGPGLGQKKPVAKVSPFTGGSQVQTATTTNPAQMSYSAASSIGSSASRKAGEGASQTATVTPVPSHSSKQEDTASLADRRGVQLGGKC